MVFIASFIGFFSSSFNLLNEGPGTIDKGCVSLCNDNAEILMDSSLSNEQIIDYFNACYDSCANG